MEQKNEFDAGKFEYSNFRKEFEEKLRIMENDIKRLSSRIEILYDNIIKKVEKLGDMEIRMGELARTVSDLEKEIDRNKVDVLSRMKKEEMENRFGEMNKKPQAFGLEKKVEDVDYRLKEVEERTAYAEMSPNIVDSQLKELLDKIIFLESRMKAMEKSLDDSVKSRPLVLE